MVSSGPSFWTANELSFSPQFFPLGAIPPDCARNTASLSSSPQDPNLFLFFLLCVFALG